MATLWELLNIICMNDVIDKHQNKPKDPVQTVKKKEVLIVLPFLGYHSKHLKKQPRSCKNKFYGIFNVKIVFFFRTPEESSLFSLTKIN